MSFVTRVLQSSSEPIYYVTGTDFTGQKAWYYLLIAKGKALLFQDAFASGNLRLSEYGKIIASGYGEEPPEELIAKLKEEYNFSDPT
jgi:hypothetical protein